MHGYDDDVVCELRFPKQEQPRQEMDRLSGSTSQLCARVPDHTPQVTSTRL